MEKTKEQISNNMSRIKSKNTGIELILRNELKNRDIHFRTNVKNIIGKPDIAIKGKKIAIFCDSTFWHGLNWDEDKNKIKTNKDFWITKIERNIERDKEVNKKLLESGWKVFRFSDKEIKNNVKDCADQIENFLSIDFPRYSGIDLFAGIGGIRLGFQQAFDYRFTIKMVGEIDKKAQETYKANFLVPEKIYDDVRKIKLNQIPKFDICLAGFPCQAFSQAGEKKGFNDKTRGTLFYEIIRICRSKQPMVIFCENVKGLLSNDHGNTIETIKKELQGIGYEPLIEVLNSKNFGVPQNRERVYIVAFRKDIDHSKFKWPTPLNDIPTIRSILSEEPVDCEFYLSDQYLNTLKKHRENHQNKNHGFGYIIKDLDDVSNTLLCGGMGRERNLIIDERTSLPEYNPRTKRKFNDQHIRVMTPKEWSRLQGFPEDYVLPVCKTVQYKQLGNSVTVNVIRSIAMNIMPVLDDHLKNGGQRYVNALKSKPDNDTT